MSATTARRKKRGAAEHRPAVRKRRFKHDDLIAGDLFSGFGGLTRGIERAGFTTIVAANHNEYKVQVHEANHPHAEHWIADLVDPESADYHSARDLPPVDLLAAGVSCVNHSQANTQKAYEQRVSLFDLEDPDFEARVTRSERDRATANCVLHYAAEHHPRLILVECTTELTSWGPALVTNPKIGDGTTYRWWIGEFGKLGYRHRVLYLNSMFFGVPQSRDRLYIAFWDRMLPAPDLDHRPHSWCSRCSTVVEAVWTWKTGVPPSGSVRYGKQYCYRCPSCRSEVIPSATPSLHALDLSNLGTRIGDKPLKPFYDKKTKAYLGDFPMAPATLARAERCRQRFADFPAVLMPAKADHGSERHLLQPMATQTSQQEAALLTTGTVLPAHRHNGDGQHITRPMDTVTSVHEKAVLLAVDNYQGAPRSAAEALPTQGGSETLGLLTARVIPNRTNGTSRSLGEPMETLVGNAGSGGLGVLSTGVVPFRQNTLPTTHGEAMPTVTSDQIPGLLTAAGTLRLNGPQGSETAPHPVSDPLGTVVGAGVTQSLLFSGWYKQNGSSPDDTAPHPVTDPLGALTSRDTTALLTAEWRAALADLPLEDCYFRMMAAHEVGRGCGFDVDFGDHKGDFIVWGSARDQVDGFGNAVSPPVGEWIGARLRAIVHGEAVA
ncbi:MAG: DNA cytosine methyltransferase [Jatrophihabitans sp.]|uniref:DNA cytosine methyltransferase n=1 Tax=Jatrophihabitans sp. TaxID=1932789 RepID=UPI003F823396